MIRRMSVLALPVVAALLGGGLTPALAATGPDVFVQSDTNYTSAYHGHSATIALRVGRRGPVAAGARLHAETTRGYTITGAPRFLSGATVPCSRGPAHVDCTLTATQLTQGVKKLRITVTGPAGTTGRIFFTVAPDSGTESHPSDNHGNEAVRMLPVADMIIGITPTSEQVPAGRPVSYTITMHNHGPDGAAVHAGLRAYFASGRVSATWSGLHVSPYSSTGATWDIGYLAPGATVTARAVVTAYDRGTSGGLEVGFESNAQDPGHCPDVACNYSAVRRITVV